MNKFIIFLFTFVCFLWTACNDDDKPTDIVKEIAMSVSSETGIMYALFDTDKEHPIECMLVKTEDNFKEWQPLAFDAIEGFTYERGHEYELRVKRTILANPPMDAPDRTYTLVSILQDRLVTEPETPDDKEIQSEEDIEYEESCPINKYAIAMGKELLVDSEGNIRYNNGDRLPSYDMARLWIENILPKDDPNWIDLQRIPYMATYIYVLSPLTDEIRLIRNGSSGPMFKDVVPEDEFNHITGSMQAGEELHYALILANVYKLGLQKLEFTLKKQ